MDFPASNLSKRGAAGGRAAAHPHQVPGISRAPGRAAAGDDGGSVRLVPDAGRCVPALPRRPQPSVPATVLPRLGGRTAGRAARSAEGGPLRRLYRLDDRARLGALSGPRHRARSGEARLRRLDRTADQGRVAAARLRRRAVRRRGGDRRIRGLAPRARRERAQPRRPRQQRARHRPVDGRERVQRAATRSASASSSRTWPSTSSSCRPERAASRLPISYSSTSAISSTRRSSLRYRPARSKRRGSPSSDNSAGPAGCRRTGPRPTKPTDAMRASIRPKS